jgi:hypothetical protein
MQGKELTSGARLSVSEKEGAGPVIETSRDRSWATEPVGLHGLKKKGDAGWAETSRGKGIERGGSLRVVFRL